MELSFNKIGYLFKLILEFFFYFQILLVTQFLFLILNIIGLIIFNDSRFSKLAIIKYFIID
jgi:hypothetical protein